MSGRRSAWNWPTLVVSALVLAVLAYVVVYALDFADKLFNVLTFVVLVLVPLLPQIPRPEWPTWMRRVFTRFRAELAAVFVFAGLALVLLFLPIPFPPHGGRWWIWNCTAALCLAMAVIVILVPSRDHPALITVSATFVLLLVAGIATIPWWPASAKDDCGAAQIAVDTRLRAAVAAALMTYQGDLSGSAECTDSLSVADVGADLHDHLQRAVTPIAAVVTSDPAVLRGLDGAWKNLGIQPDPRARWHTIGLDLASVFLLASEHRQADSVELGELARLRVGRVTPFDPVALAVTTASQGRWKSWPQTTVQDIAGRPCPSRLVLPTRSIASCLPAGSFTPVKIVDRDDNLVGAPVLGVDLTVASPDQASSPTARARKAANAFMAWLDRNPDELDLQPLTQSIRDALAPLPQQNELIRQETAPVPVHVSVVLDSSLSMGRATDRRQYGAPAPWASTIDGLRRWTQAGPHSAQDRLTVVLAHTDSGGIGRRTLDPVTGSLPRTWPPASPRGQTGLAEALEQAGRAADQHAQPGRRRLTVLLTDAVNAFTERTVPGSALDGVEVVVVRPGNGCAAVPAAVRKHCRTSDVAGPDVAAQLTALVATTRAR